MSSVLIKNGLVYDGTGAAPEKKDILIRGDKIVAIGKVGRQTVETVIDAVGGLVIPGIVDVNGQTDPLRRDLLKEGITTIVAVSDVFPPKELFNRLTKQAMEVNFGMLVDHASLRRLLTESRERDLTESEHKSLKEMLVRSFKEGALGFFSRRPYRETSELMATVADNKGVYTVELLNKEKDLIPSLEELLAAARQTDVNLQISRFQPLEKFKELYRQAKDLIENETAGYRINFDCPPLAGRLLPISYFLPRWAGQDISKYVKPRLLEHFRKLSLEKITVDQAPQPLQKLAGRKLGEFAANANLKPEEALFRLMELTNLKATIFYEDIDAGLLDEFLASPAAIISSGGVDGAFTKFLSRAAKENKIPLEEAVAKITGRPAQKYGLAGRGLIKEGSYADIVILRDYQPREVLKNGRVVKRTP